MSALIGSDAGRTAVRPIGQDGKADSPLLFLHCAIALAGNQWLGDETFRLLSFEGQESVSEPFDYQLQLHGNTSPRHGRALSFDAVIGRPVTVGINDPSVREAPDAAARLAQALREGNAPDITLYNGLVTSFAMDEPGVYRLGMKPALWKLTLTNRYCIHAQMSVRDVIAKLMSAHHIDCSLEGVSHGDNIALARTQDWLQAGESDYEFLRRIMAKAHIYYYFSHHGKGHTVVFADRPYYPKAFGDRPLRYTHSSIDELGLAQNDLVFQYSYQQSLTPSGVNGRFAHQESASQQDPVATYQTFASTLPSDRGELPFNQYRTYQYGVSSGEVQHYVSTTAASLAGSAQQLSGSSTCSGFRVGYVFTLSGEVAPGVHPAPVRPSLEGKRFVLSKVQHQASADGGYTNTFEATDAAAMLTAFSVQDTQQGVILATVVDIEGHRPDDWRYYQPANFDPESSRLRDTQATPQDLMAKGVYVKFSSPGPGNERVWVKLAAHMQTVPEIGAMELVARASDESELPEVQSIVQANGSLVVTPSGWTANTHVGSSYSTSYGDGQSIRFGRTSAYDLDRAIGIVNGQYQTGQYRDTSYSQGASYSYATAENGVAGLLSRSESYGSTYSVQEAAEVQSRSTIGNVYSEDTVTGTATRVSIQNLVQNTSTVNAQSSVSTTGLNTVVDSTGMVDSLSTTGISIGASTVGMAHQTSLTGTREDVVLTGASTSMALTGMAQSVAATGSSESTSVTGSAKQTSVTGHSDSTSITGGATQTSITGTSDDIGLVGSSKRLSVVGTSTSVSVAGSTTDVSITDREARVGMHGVSSSVDVTGAGVSLAIGLRYSLDIGGVSENIPLIYIFV
jgi:type VI secretion system secreted protein VgrG